MIAVQSSETQLHLVVWKRHASNHTQYHTVMSNRAGLINALIQFGWELLGRLLLYTHMLDAGKQFRTMDRRGDAKFWHAHKYKQTQTHSWTRIRIKGECKTVCGVVGRPLDNLQSSRGQTEDLGRT